MYPYLRLLLPWCDKDRGAYGIKESKLAKHYIKLLGLPNDSDDAKRLLNYKTPKHAKNVAGDFGEVAFTVINLRCREKGELTVADVNQKLDDLARFHAEHLPAEVDKTLFSLINGCSAMENKWLARIILGDLKLGLGEKIIFDTFHPEAQGVYDVNSSLLKVCQSLTTPQDRLEQSDKGIHLGIPFRPMRANKIDMEKLLQAMNYKSFYVETKHDGERFQIHKNGDTYAFFSRSVLLYKSQTPLPTFLA